MGKQFVIDESNAKGLYADATGTLKGVMETTFGKPFFSGKITDRIKSMDDILELLGIDEEDAWSEDDEPHVVAFKQMELICLSYNEGWVPNWNDSDEYKWYAWWYLNEPGFRLYAVLFGIGDSHVGPRLVFKSKELAQHAADLFKGVYQAYYAPAASVKEATPPKNIMDRVKSFEDACDVLGLDSDDIYTDDDTDDEVAYKKLKVIVRALNEGWTPNYNNYNERKYYPWWYLNEPGFRLYVVYYAFDFSSVGPRLVYKSEELTQYAAEHFKDLYEIYLGQL